MTENLVLPLIQVLKRNLQLDQLSGTILLEKFKYMDLDQLSGTKGHPS